ncbi:MAG: purN [Burkholderiales bacterium]|jgi:phosphoribosylglycinamide formyltransferase-1|nr:purN [Burkholderiales bacterium]
MSGIVVLISGRGSNLAALCNNLDLVKHIKGVICNNVDAPGLSIAKKFGIPSHIIQHKQYLTREEFDKHMAQIIDGYNPRYVILAGFMRILSPWFVNRYHMRLVNIHPSLLPSFIGINAIDQAFAAKVKVSGLTIHFVTDKLDHGPIIAQGVVSNKSSTLEELADKIHTLEHVAYPFIVSKLLSNKVNILDDETIVVEKDKDDIQLLGKFYNSLFY